MGKTFKSNNVYSIYKKGKIREERLNSKYEIVDRKLEIRRYTKDGVYIIWFYLNILVPLFMIYKQKLITLMTIFSLMSIGWGCIDGVEVELWGECYNIEETTILDPPQSQTSGLSIPCLLYTSNASDE